MYVHNIRYKTGVSPRIPNPHLKIIKEGTWTDVFGQGLARSKDHRTTLGRIYITFLTAIQ
jgi:hypothetical protein